jgi:hypothetical protein
MAPSVSLAERPRKFREPFKRIPCVDLRRLAGLPPAPLKVFIYHLGRSGEDDTSFPRLDTIALDTNLNTQTVKRARRWLRENGWLVTTGWKPAHLGRGVPIERTAFPPQSALRVENPPSIAPLRVEKSPGGKVTPEVDSKSFEVDGTGSDHRFSLTYPKPTTVLSPQTIKGKKQTARTILIEECGLDPDLVDVALLRVADLARALKKSPRSVAYFVASVKNSLADPDEAEQCRSIAAERRRSGLPIDAPLRPDEWHVRSKIALIHESVEVAQRDDRDAREVQAEMIAAIEVGP